MEGTESQRVRHLIWALLTVPADVSRFDRDGIIPERTVESAHSALVGVGAQDLCLRAHHAAG